MAMVDYQRDSAHGQLVYIHNDHLGTPKFMTDERMTVVWRDEVLPFGERIASLANTNLKLKFPGQYLDEDVISRASVLATSCPASLYSKIVLPVSGLICAILSPNPL